ncbi:hypothetical protein VKT23_008664 [Stygiomarasmius scandens]|uniref:Uncharacterized protein n=1 Tax=Marasmiellus scandens TaxID=2682957 RepID=A0ABR1JJD1_9AGAR
MKYTLFASLLVVCNILDSVVASQLTFYEVADPTNPVVAVPTNTAAAIPIGTADGATTYRIEDTITNSLTNTHGAVSTLIVTFTETIVASAAGWKVQEPAEEGKGGGEIECQTPDAQGNGECVGRENLNGTTIAVTQTGSMFPFQVISVSQNGAAGNGGSGSSESGNDNNTADNGSSSGLGSGSSLNNNAARRMIAGMVCAVVCGVVFGGLLLI